MWNNHHLSSELDFNRFKHNDPERADFDLAQSCCGRFNAVCQSVEGSKAASNLRINSSCQQSSSRLLGDEPRGVERISPRRLRRGLTVDLCAAERKLGDWGLFKWQLSADTVEKLCTF